MSVRLYRILACIIPVQCATMLGFAWYATRPVAVPLTQKADRIVVSKANHTLTLYARNEVIHTYKVSLGRSPGAKRREGDHRTPEGEYIIDRHNSRSAFHLALHISYPNADDKARAQAAHAAPGGDIMIHGLRNGLGALGSLQSALDWTDGCIAVTDAQMDEIYRLVPDNTPIDIQP
jgi:murein L,D-transpeptidase YafK